MVKNQKNKKGFIDDIKFLYPYLKERKRNLVLIFIMTLIFSLILCGSIIGQFYFMKFLLDFVSGKPNWTTLIIFSTLLITGYVLNYLLYLFQTIFMTKIAQKIGRDIRMDIYSKLLDMKIQYFDQEPSGNIMSKLTNDVMNITNALTQNTTQIISQISQMLFMFIALIIFSPLLTLISLLVMPLQIIFLLIMSKKTMPLFMKRQNVIGDMNAYIEEMISGQKIINNLDYVHEVMEDFDKKNQKIKMIQKKSNAYAMSNGPWLNTMSYVAVIITVIVAIFIYKKVELGTISKVNSDAINLASLLFAFNLLYMGFATPIYQIFQMWAVIQQALAGIKRVKTIMIQDNENLDIEKLEMNFSSGDILIKDLSFSYDNKKNVLKNLNIEIKDNQKIGIVGPTGSGKTTLINLLTKFYNIHDGDILFNGQSIKELTKKSLRKNVSIVLQDSYFFEGTVYDNLRIANSEASNEEIIEICKKADIHKFINLLPNKYETILTNNAEDFSQGQKQLLSIARSMLKQSKILILDEATSFVDTKSEESIQNAMIEASKNKTTFIIAHRLSTIKHVDKIIVLKDGEILEQGNHNELMQQKGFYFNMYSLGLNTPEDI